MKSPAWTSSFLAAACLATTPLIWCAEEKRKSGTRREEPMVAVAEACPDILVELRYAGSRNVTGAAIYPPKARCLLRRSVAERLNRAQDLLRERGARLKIWDGYRPAWAQEILWRFIQNPAVIGNPDRGGSLHSWGACVDVTLVDQTGRELLMPTDFDDFTPAAHAFYIGPNRTIATNVQLLQVAMMKVGFVRMRDEWWHFTSPDALDFGRAEIALDSP